MQPGIPVDLLDTLSMWAPRVAQLAIAVGVLWVAWRVSWRAGSWLSETRVVRYAVVAVLTLSVFGFVLGGLDGVAAATVGKTFSGLAIDRLTQLLGGVA